MVTFSIIVPCYNVEKYLAACLDSVLAQTYSDFECICVNDGSTDGTPSILEEYAKKDGRISVIHQTNGGLGFARYKGTQNAHGKYIIHLDSDDLWNNDTLNTCHKMIESYGDADIFGFTFVTFQDGTTPKWIDCDDTFTVTDTFRIIPTSLIRRGIWGYAYKREIVPDKWYPKYCIGEDLSYISRVLIKANSVVITSKPLYGYRMRQGSAMHTKSTAEGLAGRQDFFEDWLTLMLKSPKPFEKSAFRMVSLGMTEHLIYDMASLRGPLVDAAWKRHFTFISSIKDLSPLPLWNRIVIRLSAITHIRFVAIILGALPFWLKRHGIRRRR